jgi:hypothetical protein
LPASFVNFQEKRIHPLFLQRVTALPSLRACSETVRLHQILRSYFSNATLASLQELQTFGALLLCCKTGSPSILSGPTEAHFGMDVFVANLAHLGASDHVSNEPTRVNVGGRSRYCLRRGWGRGGCCTA